ncbi:MAG: hypothetical protein LUG98_09350 [Tannerellaceae bacterium]|nr:hypothetical protein [Tannerellaceae bacterium]
MTKAKHAWFILMFLLFIAGIGAVTMLLWNALIPAIFGGIVINYWQAIGLLVLSRLLFGGFGFHHMAGRFGRHPHSHPHLSQMHGMSRGEKREFIRRHMESHFCCDPEKNSSCEPKEE